MLIMMVMMVVIVIIVIMGIMVMMVIIVILNSQNGHWSKGGSRESDIHNVNLFTQIEISVQNFTPKMRKF